MMHRGADGCAGTVADRAHGAQRSTQTHPGRDSMPSDVEIYAAESRLRSAMLDGDAEALEALLSEDLVFTDEDGRSVTRDEEVAEFRSRRLRLEVVEVEDLQVRMLGDCAVACLRVRMAGMHDGHSVAGHYAFTRIWRRQDGAWRVEAVHCSAVAR
jgi:ketosteroid isomerase-like protein